MANIKSQEKRILISEGERLDNKAKKSRVNTNIKKFNESLKSRDKQLAETLLKDTIALIDRARLDGVYHQNTASRKKSALQKALNQAK